MDWGDQRLLYVYADPGRNLNIFDITEPRNTKLLYVEYDRNIIWAFTNHANYALTSPALGEPVCGMPEKPWPPRD